MALAALLCGAVFAQAPLRVLVVTGGHDYPTSFYTLFEQPGLAWDHAVTNEAAFRRDLGDRYDVLVLYDMHQSLSEAGRAHLKAFAEAGKGLVVLHHAIVSYDDWPWYHDLVGGHYWERAAPGRPASTYRHDEDIALTVARPHPVTDGLSALRVHDETYKGMTISPGALVLLKTDNPMSDGPVAWVSPYARSRVVYIQIGHGREAHRHEGYRTLIGNALAWAGGRR